MMAIPQNLKIIQEQKGYVKVADGKVYTTQEYNDMLSQSQDKTQMQQPAQPSKSKLDTAIEFAEDIAYPAIGGTAGFAVGGPVGALAGAGVGKAAQEFVEARRGVDKYVVPGSVGEFFLGDTVLGNIAMEPIQTVLGGPIGKGVSKVAKPIARKVAPLFQKSKQAAKGVALSLGKVADDVAKDMSKAKPTFDKLGSFFSKVLKGVTPEKKDQMIREIALNNEQYNMPRYITEQTLKRDAVKVLKPEYLSRDTFNTTNIKKAASKIDEMFTEARKDFETYVTPLKQDKITFYDINDLKDQWIEEIAEIATPVKVKGKTGEEFSQQWMDDMAKIGTLVKVKGKTKKVRGNAKLEAGPEIDQQAANDLLKFVKEKFAKAWAKPNFINLFGTKKKIDKMVNRKLFINNPAARNILIGLRKNIDNVLKENTKYADVMNQYKTIYDFEEDIAGLAKNEKIMALAKKYLKPENSLLIENMDKYIKKTNNQAMNEVINETLAKNYISRVKEVVRGSGLRESPYIGFPVRIFMRKSPEKFGKELIKISKSGKLEGKGIQAARAAARAARVGRRSALGAGVGAIGEGLMPDEQQGLQ